MKSVVEEKFNSPFNYIHSVGDFWKHKNIINTDFAEVNNLILSHYVTLFYVLKTIIPVMQNLNGGKIFAFSCNSVKYNYPDMAAFTSAKAAVECLIKCVANEQAQYNITANAFALPSVKTKSVIETKPEEFHRDYITLDELTESIQNIVECFPTYANGTIINIIKHSNSFYHMGYYERNMIWTE